MTYTVHGHHIPGTEHDKTVPGLLTPCGGPGVCATCSQQAASIGIMHKAAIKLQRELELRKE